MEGRGESEQQQKKRKEKRGEEGKNYHAASREAITKQNICRWQAVLRRGDPGILPKSG